jgi:hypothetical protein
MRRKMITSLSLGLLLCTPTFAQNNEANEAERQFSIGAQIRSRAEHRNGAFFPLTSEMEPASFINNRSRISMNYSQSRLSLGLAAQNVGVWGQDAQIVNSGRFMLNEAWANINADNGIFFKIGRQALAYDDERILGALDWNISGRFHDALKTGFENSHNKLHLILAYNQNSERFSGAYYAPGGQPYKTMQTLWYQYTKDRTFSTSLLLLNLGLEAGEPEKAETKYMQTMGTNISFSPVQDLRLYGTAYLQAGKTINDQTISAFMWALNASYKAAPKWTIMAASDYLSGNSDNSDRYGAFNPLYGTHHKFYGTMDYFYASSFINGLNPGLWDNQLGVSYAASRKVTLMLNYHHFQTTTDVYAGDVKQSRSLGSEWDFQVNWNIMKDVSLVGGYSVMFGNDTMKTVKGGDPSRRQDWTWLTVNINPQVFSTGW